MFVSFASSPPLFDYGQKEFLRETEKVKEHGFALDNQENSLNARCLAAPVFNGGGTVIAALGTSTTLLQLDKSQLPKCRRIGESGNPRSFPTDGLFRL